MQRVILLLVVCIFFFSLLFVCSVHVYKDFLYLQCFLFVKAVSPVGHCSEGCDLANPKVIFFFRTGLFQTLSCWGRAKKRASQRKN